MGSIRRLNHTGVTLKYEATAEVQLSAIKNIQLLDVLTCGDTLFYQEIFDYLVFLSQCQIIIK